MDFKFDAHVRNDSPDMTPTFCAHVRAGNHNY